MRNITPRFPKRRRWLEPKYFGLVRKYQALLLAQSQMETELAGFRDAIAWEQDMTIKATYYAEYARLVKRAGTLGTKVNGARNAMVAELERTKL